MSNLDRRVSRMEARQSTQKVRRFLISAFDASEMTDAEREARIAEDAARLGLEPEDMHIVLTTPSADGLKHLRERRKAKCCSSLEKY